MFLGAILTFIVALENRQAIRELEEPLYDTEQMNTYIALIKEKLGITDQKFE